MKTWVTGGDLKQVKNKQIKLLFIQEKKCFLNSKRQLLSLKNN